MIELRSYLCLATTATATATATVAGAAERAAAKMRHEHSNVVAVAPDVQAARFARPRVALGTHRCMLTPAARA